MKKILALTLVLLVPAGVIFCLDDYGTESLFVLGAGARAAGMGGAYTALADDVSGAYYNPAGLAELPRQEVSLLHYPLYLGTYYNSIIYANPVLDFGTVGGGIFRVSSGNVNLFTSSDFPDGTGGFEEYKAMVSYARKVTNELSLGLNINIFSVTLAKKNAGGFGADLGLIYVPFPFLKFGAVAHNLIAPSLAMNFENESLSQDYTLGAAYILKADPVQAGFCLDMDKQEKAGPRIRAGVEAMVFNSASARAGWDENRLTLGAGARLYGVTVDYACIFNPDTGPLSRFALSYSFGQSLQEQKEERKQNALKEVKVFVEEEMNKKTMAEADKCYEKAAGLFAKGKYEASLKSAEQALGWNSAHAGAIGLRKNLLLKLLDGNYKTAVARYKEKDYLNALSGFMQVKSVDENYRDTQNYIGKINSSLQLAGESGKLFSEGMDCFVNKDYETAIKKWTAAIDVKPELKFLKEYIRKAAESKARSEAGRELTKAELDRVRDLNYAGVNLYIKGNLEGAIAQWEKALEIDPGNIDVLKNFERANNELNELKKRGMK
jgi:tetratricopeptide (TPR) repeat protein